MDRATIVNWNRAMAAMHGLFLVVTLFTAKMDMKLPLFKSNITIAEQGTSSAWTVPGQPAFDRDLYIAWVAAAFSALSAFFHLGNAQLWRDWYLKGILQCRCPSRWIEYSLSAPLQAIAIAYFTGSDFTDVLVAIFFLISTTMFFGLLTEEYAARPLDDKSWISPWRARLLPHFLGYVPFIAAVAIMLQSFLRGAAFEVEVDGEIRRMPSFVYAIVISQLLLFSSFTVVQLVVTLRPPSRYYQGEIAYMALSLGAKGVLSLLLLSNVIAIDVFGSA